MNMKAFTVYERQLSADRTLLIVLNVFLLVAVLALAYMWSARVSQVSIMNIVAERDHDTILDAQIKISNLNKTVSQLKHNENQVEELRRKVFAETMKSFETTEKSWDKAIKSGREVQSTLKNLLDEKQKTLNVVQLLAETLGQQVKLQDEHMALQREKLKALVDALGRYQKALKEEREAHQRHHQNESPDDPASILG